MICPHCKLSIDVEVREFVKHTRNCQVNNSPGANSEKNKLYNNQGYNNQHTKEVNQ